MLRIDPGERPTAIQLFGSVPAELAEAARIVAGNGADVIDFNMGCPVPKVVNNGEGSALMKKSAAGLRNSGADDRRCICSGYCEISCWLGF